MASAASQTGAPQIDQFLLLPLTAPGDIVVVDRNCHKSHHYGMVLTGAPHGAGAVARP